jgi:hypothetical protein
MVVKKDGTILEEQLYVGATQLNSDMANQEKIIHFYGTT